MDVQELVAINRRAIEGLPEADQPAALRRLVAIVEGDNVESDLVELSSLLRAQIARPDLFSGVDDQGLPIYKLTPDDIAALDEHDREVEAGTAQYASPAEVEAEFTRLGGR